jgi:hypothetical protein
MNQAIFDRASQKMPDRELPGCELLQVALEKDQDRSEAQRGTEVSEFPPCLFVPSGKILRLFIFCQLGFEIGAVEFRHHFFDVYLGILHGFLIKLFSLFFFG